MFLLSKWEEELLSQEEFEKLIIMLDDTKELALRELKNYENDSEITSIIFDRVYGTDETNEKQIAWVDIRNKKHSMDELSDEYLLNILELICNGGGWAHFVTNEKIIDLFNEADRRGLKHKNSLSKAMRES